MIKGYAKKIEKIYSNLRKSEEDSLKSKKEEIKAKLPRVIEIDSEISKLCIKLSTNIFKKIDNRDEYIKALKNEITNLRMKRSELLVSNGYPMDYLQLHYNCTKCKDTGYIGAEKCSCYKNYLVKLYYDNSDLKVLLEKNNFDNFNINYYSSRKSESDPRSPRKNIEKILSLSINYIKNFKDLNENLLFYGNSGTGKTFLSHCIAKDLLNKGYLVIYKTSSDLAHDLKQLQFEPNPTLEDLLLNCDLLIIDDLGTEQISAFSKTCLFNLLNKKLLLQKKMLISSNYNLEELTRLYSERITSRLFGEFTLCKFYGDDIRINRNLKNRKI
ncbi:ATP-binding protein [Clostridium felsineum]|uniref:ATP-binding protein n=1 Tax=Clostridium felsineum TaxID=36839 RepID=UPI0009C71A49|nr:ATP-binding protein [Clostridium felsineum]URZ14323.1 Chromosomal replication initiator protein DnaA [Clostridium felsineum DSM 794]